VSRLPARLAAFLRRSRRLSRAGVTMPSLLLLPIRRRLRDSRSVLALRNGVRLASPRDEPLVGIFEEVWVNRCYAPDAGEPPSGAVIVDVGAHVGVFTTWAAARYPAARVVAVEPSARMCAELRANVATSGLANVTILEAACGGSARAATLYGRGCEGMNSLYESDGYGSRFYPLQPTAVLTLDQIVERAGAARIWLLKLDCEGAEYEILFGAAPSTLARVDRIAMEYHLGLAPGSPQALADHLAAAGFDVRWSPPEDEEGGYLRALRRA